jgi:hypothetical protein
VLAAELVLELDWTIASAYFVAVHLVDLLCACVCFVIRVDQIGFID